MTDTTYRVGDIVRHKNTGRLIQLDDVNDNPNYIQDNEYWAEGFSQWGSESIDTPEDIEKVMTADEAAARQLPSIGEIARSLNLLGEGWGGVFDVEETEYQGNGSVVCVGTAANGLRLTFTVTVSEVWEADL